MRKIIVLLLSLALMLTPAGLGEIDLSATAAPLARAAVAAGALRRSASGRAAHEAELRLSAAARTGKRTGHL